MVAITRAASQSLSVPHCVAKPKNGKDILDTLILVAEDVERRTTIEDFARWWLPDGTYRDFVYESVIKFSMNEKPGADYGQPISAYNQQFHGTLAQMAPLLSCMNVIDEERLFSLPDDAKMLGVSYTLWYSMNSSRHLFTPANPAHYEYDGVSRRMSLVYAALSDVMQRLRGRRSIDEVGAEVLGCLLPFRVSDPAKTIAVLALLPHDVFAYGSRYFALKREMTGCCGEMQPTERNSGSWPILLSSYALYHPKSSVAPLAYIVFKDTPCVLPSQRTIGLLSGAEKG